MIKKYALKDLLFNKICATVFFMVTFLSYCQLNLFFSGSDMIIDYLSIGICSIIIILYVLNFKYSKFTLAITCFIILLLISSCISESTTFITCFKIYYRILAISYYIDWAVKVNLKNLIKTLYFSLLVLVTINFITIVCYPNGMYVDEYANNWFLGYDNTHIFWYVPTILLALIDQRMENKKNNISFIFTIIIITYSVYFCFSANSVVTYTLLLAYLIISNNKEQIKIEFINPKIFFLIFVILFFAIVIMRMQNIFSWLIVDILNKDLTFTNRTIIWDEVLKLIKNNWVIGYGVEDSLVMASKLGNSHFAHAHNTILDIVYKGGVVALIPFIYLIHITIENLNVYKNEKISKSISVIVFCIFIMMLFEAREETIGLYIIFEIAYCIKSIINEKQVKMEDIK